MVTKTLNCFFFFFQNSSNFPSSPVVKTWSSNAGGAGSISGWETKIPSASQPKNQNIRQKCYCNKFSKTSKKKKNLLYKKWSKREALSDGVDDRYIIVAQPDQPNRRWCHLLRGYDKVRVEIMNQFGEQFEGLAGLQLKTFSDFQAQWVAPSITEGRGGLCVTPRSCSNSPSPPDSHLQGSGPQKAWVTVSYPWTMHPS